LKNLPKFRVKGDQKKLPKKFHLGFFFNKSTRWEGSKKDEEKGREGKGQRKVKGQKKGEGKGKKNGGEFKKVKKSVN
jgi:hypothetical protein